jgi:putative ABC transport system permease protein
MTSVSFMFASLRHRWLRTAITCSSVALSIGLLVSTLSIQLQLSDNIQSFDIPFLTVRPRAADGKLPFAYIERIRKEVPNADPVDWWRAIGGNDGNDHTFIVNSWSDFAPDDLPKTFTYIEPEVRARWRAQRRGLLADETTLAQTQWKVGDHVTFHSPIGDIEADLVGSYTNQMPGWALLHFDYLNSLLPDKDRLDAIVVRAAREHLLTVATAIDRLFDNSPEPTLTISWSALAQSFVRNMRVIPDLMLTISILSMVISMVIISMTIAMSLRERRHEFATLRAMGFVRARIVLLVFGETVVTCLLGGVLGVIGTFAVFSRGVSFDPSLEPAPITVTVVLLGLAVTLGEALIAAIIPAFRLVRRSILDGLRGD